MITSMRRLPLWLGLAGLLFTATTLQPATVCSQSEEPVMSSPPTQGQQKTQAPRSSSEDESSPNGGSDGGVGDAATPDVIRTASVGAPLATETADASVATSDAGVETADAGASDERSAEGLLSSQSADAGVGVDGGVETAESTTDPAGETLTAQDPSSETVTVDTAPTQPAESAGAAGAANQTPGYPLMPFWPFMPEAQPRAPASDDHGDRTVVLMPDFDAFGRFFPELPKGGVLSALSTFLLLVLAMALARQIRRYREHLPDRGLFPSLVSLANILTRLAALTLFMGIVAQLMPPALAKALPWVLIATAAAVGWSARDFLPDATAAMVIAFERRIRPGVWLSGSSFQGVVEGRGLRAIWIRDGRGQRIAVPNRRLLNEPITTHTSAGSVHDVSLRLESTAPASEVRRALVDAVLASPWTQPYFTPTIRRDGETPSIWHVRTHLLDVGFAMQFEGELLERVEEMLAGRYTSNLSPIAETPAV